MTILNTTFALDPTVSAQALEWIRTYFRHKDCQAPMLARVIAREQADCETYALHLEFPSASEAEAWRDGHGAALLRSMARKWGERALCFQTMLEVIE